MTTFTDRDVDVHQLIERVVAQATALHEFRQWLDTQEAGHATHVPIAEVRRVFGWTGRGTG